MTSSGFTLIEIVVTMSIIIIFSLVSLSGYKDFVSKASLRSIAYNYISFVRLAQTYASGSVNIENTHKNEIVLTIPVIDGKPQTQSIYIIPHKYGISFYELIKNYVIEQGEMNLQPDTLLVESNRVEQQQIPVNVNIFASVCLLKDVPSDPSLTDTLISYCEYNAPPSDTIPIAIGDFTLFMTLGEGGYNINIFAIPQDENGEYNYSNSIGAGNEPMDVGARFFVYTKVEDEIDLITYIEMTELGNVFILQ